MSSILDTCNRALGHIGANKVQQVFPSPEDSEEARACYQFFDQARKTTLEAVDWKFASREKTLSLTGTPPAKWGYQYAYPADCLMPREIVKSTRSGDSIPFDTSLSDDELTRIILTDSENASLRYTRDLSNTELWPTIASEVLCWRLGMLIAVPITRSTDMQKVCERGFQLALGDAKTVLANLPRKDKKRRARWIEGRW